MFELPAYYLWSLLNFSFSIIFTFLCGLISVSRTAQLHVLEPIRSWSANNVTPDGTFWESECVRLVGFHVRVHHHYV
jgi:hypothetical protein